MKNLILLTLLVMSCFSDMMAQDTVKSPERVFVDTRDSTVYRLVQIGTQLWMAENLKYLPEISPPSFGSKTDPLYYVYGYTGNSVIDAKNNWNLLSEWTYHTYGVLYNLSSAKRACPEGSHLPGHQDWETLRKQAENYVNIFLIESRRPSDGIGGVLKEDGTSHWYNPNMGEVLDFTVKKDGSSTKTYYKASNLTGFTALPGGVLEMNTGFTKLGSQSWFWSDTDSGNAHVDYRSLVNESGGFFHNQTLADNALSVRCIMDEVSSFQPIARFVINPDQGTCETDYQFDATGCMDPNTARSELEFRWDWNGDGTWDTPFSQEKVVIKRYLAPGQYSVILQVRNQDGFLSRISKIVSVLEAEPEKIMTDHRDQRVYRVVKIGDQTWMAENLAYLPEVSPSSEISSQKPHYYVYNYEGISTSQAKSDPVYSTFGALYNWAAAKIACPGGWHLPSVSEWEKLTRLDSAKKLKALNNISYSRFWDYDSNNANGFKALRGGGVDGKDGFKDIGRNIYFWSASEQNSENAWNLYFGTYAESRSHFKSPKSIGFSVRCIKD
ncbi:MAG: FISUMP domain-containing protein [Bacteroidota bacterium]